MALLAQNDWHPPRDSDSMDNPAGRSQHPSAPRQASPDAVQNAHAQAQAQFTPQTSMPQQQQPFAAQSQPWQPSPQAAPFFPAYPPFFPTPGPLPHPGTSPYFDPNLAHWAYQQMLFNAQAQAQFHAHQQHQVQHQMLQQAEFPRTQSGTPPQQTPHQSPDYFSQSRPDGFHPYSVPPRRPGRQASSSSSPSSPQLGNDSAPHPPYARADAAGSSSSVNSGSSGGSRTRKSSNPSTATQHTHGRTISSTSRSSSNTDRPPSIKSSKSSSSPSSTTPPARPSKPSPLGLSHSYPAAVTNGAPSQSASKPNSTGTARPSSPTTPRAEPTPLPSPKPTHNKRLSISKDDLQLGESIPVPSATMIRSGGLKGRLRRALSFNAASTLDGAQESDDGKLNSRRKALANASKNNAAASSSEHADDTSPPGSPPTPTGPSAPPVDTKGKSRIKRSLFNPRLNASTDNISLSSTVSSASVMIRKLGSMGRLARKNSIMTITGLFGKDKDKRAAPAEASVSHATVEVERGSDNDLMSGLTPAARLARQHTLRSNEEAAKRKAEEEARAKELVAHEADSQPATVPVWERGTTNRRGDRIGGVILEDDEDGSGSGSDDSDGTYDPHHWADDDGDLTIRVSQHPQVYTGSPSSPQEDETWAVGISRSEERTKRPTKGILKNAGTYDQETVLAQNSAPPTTRVRSNSYNHNTVHAEPGPLARIPSPDPDHIDGLHQHKDYLPPFTFEDANQRSSSPQPEKDKSSFFNLANMNSSAPALSTLGLSSSSPPPLTHRSATAPVKRLTFAANLSIYDTFSSTVYDRRSEPATCNRLTPALAQRIKEELNSYKMEEMEVHAASRIHTQFFV